MKLRLSIYLIVILSSIKIAFPKKPNTILDRKQLESSYKNVYITEDYYSGPFINYLSESGWEIKYYNHHIDAVNNNGKIIRLLEKSKTSGEITAMAKITNLFWSYTFKFEKTIPNAKIFINDRPWEKSTDNLGSSDEFTHFVKPKSENSVKLKSSEKVLEHLIQEKKNGAKFICKGLEVLVCQ